MSARPERDKLHAVGGNGIEGASDRNRWTATALSAAVH
jgi:hypothetical protein